ncbi:MAG: hypothetical protein OSB10_02700 [Planctomycetota bacterium]|nr:hypothetical protein [Planctomycetota bacterium]
MATPPSEPLHLAVEPVLPTSELERLIGTEQRLGAVGRAIVSVARKTHSKHVATLHVTCSDEREKECADDFVNTVVRELGDGPYTRRAPMRTANLGARYEWGCAPLASNHFDAEGTANSLLIIKISSHVGFVQNEGVREYGLLDREHLTTHSCGALCCLLDGATKPFTHELELLFGSEGLDRLGLLRDVNVIPAAERAVAAGVINARLQARKAMLDVGEHSWRYPGKSPERILVVSCVTINRPGVDHELLAGFYGGVLDSSSPSGVKFTWTGLSDDPQELAVTHVAGALNLTCDTPPTRLARGPREHRQLALHKVLKETSTPVEVHSAVDTAIAEIQASIKSGSNPSAKLALTGLAALIGELMPIAGLALLFSSGAVELHHAWRVHRVAHGQASHTEALALFEEISDNFDQLSEGEAKLAIERLALDLK